MVGRHAPAQPICTVCPYRFIVKFGPSPGYRHWFSTSLMNANYTIPGRLRPRPLPARFGSQPLLGRGVLVQL